MARIVVTGAAGFIGSHLSERLLADGHDVVGLDSYIDYYPRPYKDTNVGRLRDLPRFTLLETDLTEALPGQASEGVEVVFHLAAQAGVRASWGASFRAYTDCNVLATQRVLEGAQRAGVRQVVYASSSSIYGEQTELPLREDLVARPNAQCVEGEQQRIGARRNGDCMLHTQECGHGRFKLADAL